MTAHGWKVGDPVAQKAIAAPTADPALAAPKTYKPAISVAQASAKGYRSTAELDPGRKVAVLRLEQKNRLDYWLTFDNFYVITRYNRSPMYAMAVLQLSEEIQKGMGGT